MKRSYFLSISNKDVTIISDSKREFLSPEGALEEYLHYLTASPGAAATSYGEPQGTQDVNTQDTTSDAGSQDAYSCMNVSHAFMASSL